MKKLLIVQNSATTPIGSTADWARARGLEPVLFKAWEPNVWDTQTWLDSPELAGVVLCGGPMNVDEEDKHPWLIKEKLFIKDALRRPIKTLGLCLGAQLMAEVLGAKVGPHTHWEVGWHRIDLHPHPSWAAQPTNLTAFQWHRYTFAIPPGAQALASSAACANQCFSFGSHGLAFQFHPESTQEWIRDCAGTPAATYPEGPFVQSAPEILAQLQDQVLLQQWYWQVLDHFFLAGR
jgi:GMP synthase-like glutamine amidotransferase